MSQKCVDPLGALLRKVVTQTIENKTIEQRGRSFSMMLHTLDGSLLGNVLLGKGVI